MLLLVFCPVCPRALPEAAPGTPPADGEAAAAAFAQEEDNKENDSTGMKGTLQRAGSARVEQSKEEASQRANREAPKQDPSGPKAGKVRSIAALSASALQR